MRNPNHPHRPLGYVRALRLWVAGQAAETDALAHRRMVRGSGRRWRPPRPGGVLPATGVHGPGDGGDGSGVRAAVRLADRDAGLLEAVPGGDRRGEVVTDPADPRR